MQIKLKSQPRHRKRVKVAPEAINAHARQFGPEAVLCIVVSAFFLPAISSGYRTLGALVSS